MCQDNFEMLKDYELSWDSFLIYPLEDIMADVNYSPNIIINQILGARRADRFIRSRLSSGTSSRFQERFQY